MIWTHLVELQKNLWLSYILHLLFVIKFFEDFSQLAEIDSFHSYMTYYVHYFLFLFCSLYHRIKCLGFLCRKRFFSKILCVFFSFSDESFLNKREIKIRFIVGYNIGRAFISRFFHIAIICITKCTSWLAADLKFIPD